MHPFNNKQWPNYHPQFKVFKSPRPLQICFDIRDYQGDGFVVLTIGICYRSVQLAIPFPNDKHRYSFGWKLFK
jgi:hypothetical protein